jgi:hypothetical protein
MDGEAFFAEKLSVELLPRRIQFFTPRGMSFENYAYKAYKSAKKKAGARDEK